MTVTDAGDVPLDPPPAVPDGDDRLNDPPEEEPEEDT